MSSWQSFVLSELYIRITQWLIYRQMIRLKNKEVGGNKISRELKEGHQKKRL